MYGCVCVHLRKNKKIRREVTEFVEHGEKREKKGANMKLIK